jgi:hypothetical protein
VAGGGFIDSSETPVRAFGDFVENQTRIVSVLVAWLMLGAGLGMVCRYRNHSPSQSTDKHLR